MSTTKLFRCAALCFAVRASAFVTSPAARASAPSNSAVRHIRSSALSMVSVGEKAPDFKLKDQNNKMVSLGSFRNKKSVVVFFYPKDNTPGCTKEANAFQSDLDKFKKMGAEVIGISSDEDHTDFAGQYGLKMSLLSDVGGKVRKEWKVKGAMFGALDGRVTYVIDKNGVVTSMYDNLLDGASHSKEAMKALAA